MEPAIKSNGVPLINSDGTPALCKPGGCCGGEEVETCVDVDEFIRDNVFGKEVVVTLFSVANPIWDSGAPALYPCGDVDGVYILPPMAWSPAGLRTVESFPINDDTLIVSLVISWCISAPFRVTTQFTGRTVNTDWRNAVAFNAEWIEHYPLPVETGDFYPSYIAAADSSFGVTSRCIGGAGSTYGIS